MFLIAKCLLSRWSLADRLFGSRLLLVFCFNTQRPFDLVYQAGRLARCCGFTTRLSSNPHHRATSQARGINRRKKTTRLGCLVESQIFSRLQLDCSSRSNHSSTFHPAIIASIYKRSHEISGGKCPPGSSSLDYICQHVHLRPLNWPDTLRDELLWARRPPSAAFAQFRLPIGPRTSR